MASLAASYDVKAKVSFPIGTGKVAVHVTGAVAVQPGAPAVNAIVCDEYWVEPCVMTTLIEVTLEGKYCGKRRAFALAVLDDGMAITIATELLPDDAEAPDAFAGWTAVVGSDEPWPPPQPANNAVASVKGMRCTGNFFIILTSFL
jgi:hypothetical protein